jgi:hypothetical protein
VSFDSIERSVQDSVTAELYELVGPAQTYRITSFGTDVTFGGRVYTATTAARSSLSVVDLGSDQSDVTLQIPATHPIAQYYAVGVPPRELLVTLTKFHVTWGVSSQFWQGYASSISFAGDTATFRVPSGTNDALALDMPSVVVQRTCNHVFGDAQCTIALSGFTVATSITTISADARTIGIAGVVPSVPNTQSPWALHGYVQSASGERRTIIDQPSGDDGRAAGALSEST